MISRGTTPSILFTFSTIPVTDITQAYLTIEQRGKLIVECDIAEAIIDAENGCITWTLTQEETLLIKPDQPCEIQCRYKTSSGFVGASKIFTEYGGNILKDGVI